jgi:hypothetical protein
MGTSAAPHAGIARAHARIPATKDLVFIEHPFQYGLQQLMCGKTEPRGIVIYYQIHDF